MNAISPATVDRHALHNPSLTGIACGAGAGALWGLVFLAPALVQEFNPLLLSVTRYLCYGLIAAILIGAVSGCVEIRRGEISDGVKLSI